jgi:uncharacterized RDD family membrane protein YckC
MQWPAPNLAEPPPGVPRLASWGRRLVAIILDGLLLLIPAGVGIGLVFLGDGGDDNAANGALAVAGGVLVILSITVLQGVYYTVMIARSGQTYGKRALGIKVIDEEGGGSIGYGRAFGRWFVPFVLGWLCGFLNILDGLWPLWDARNQTWHDKIANTVVVRVPSP